MNDIGRRDFIGLLAAAAVFRARAAPVLAIRVTGEDPAVRRGADLGFEEARHAAAMFGGSITRERASGGIEILIGRATVPPDGAIAFNVSDAAPEARVCHRSLFHVAPAGSILAWHPSLTRFGADTLNKRFRSRYDADMTSAAWCAWFAVKCAWEGALKSRATSAAELGAFLALPTTRFDGHKGVPLSFDPAHQLVQPVYDDAGKDAFTAGPERLCRW